MKILNKLVKIGKSEYFALRDMYYPFRSTSHIGYSTMDNYIRWFEQDPNIQNVAVYCLNGDYSDGTFVAIVSNVTIAEFIETKIVNVF